MEETSSSHLTRDADGKHNSVSLMPLLRPRGGIPGHQRRHGAAGVCLDAAHQAASLCHQEDTGRVSGTRRRKRDVSCQSCQGCGAAPLVWAFSEAARAHTGTHPDLAATLLDALNERLEDQLAHCSSMRQDRRVGGVGSGLRGLSSAGHPATWMGSRLRQQRGGTSSHSALLRTRSLAPAHIKIALVGERIEVERLYRHGRRQLLRWCKQPHLHDGQGQAGAERRRCMVLAAESPREAHGTPLPATVVCSSALVEIGSARLLFVLKQTPPIAAR